MYHHKSLYRILGATLALLLLVGCSSTSTTDPGGDQPQGTVGYLDAIYTAFRTDSQPTNLTVRATASTRLLLIDLVGEQEQQRLVGEWNAGRHATATTQSSVLSTDKKVDYLHTIYKALGAQSRPNDSTVRAIASTRLLLIEAVGEKEQQRLIGEWNAEK